ncbi:SAM-dependent methyltransferase [Nocardia bovistercoris]|uniref:SAM-dependent methyltransferase n=1 Tax=Nocardia bovistercoris TaxID=2785916 RepID=A0A931IAD0_9NOCA|nr:SAM-dependent methyltransferase [Nocardia bovistercoris]MBH0776805.1 SAM-dependent methyltransferase [Nocardia bovistercoris]
MSRDTEDGATPRTQRVPVGADPTKPNAARVYNYMLGGKDNYEVDQILAHQMLSVAPDTRTTAWFSRRFLLHAVEFAAEAGVRQFIDIGAGIPISPNVHEIAQKIEPSARVVAVDYDPVVHVHSNALLGSTAGVTAVLGDIRRPAAILEQLRAERLIDFDQPVAILIVGVLHYIMDDEDPAGIIATLRDAVAPGSYLAFTHATVDTHADFIDRSSSSTAGSSAQPRYRTRDEVAALLEGFDVLEPGVVTVQDWLDDDLPATKLVVLGGIGRTV